MWLSNICVRVHAGAHAHTCMSTRRWMDGWVCLYEDMLAIFLFIFLNYITHLHVHGVGGWMGGCAYMTYLLYFFSLFLTISHNVEIPRVIFELFRNYSFAALLVFIGLMPNIQIAYLAQILGRHKVDLIVVISLLLC